MLRYILQSASNARYNVIVRYTIIHHKSDFSDDVCDIIIVVSVQKLCVTRGSVVAERLRALDSNSCVSDQQSVGLNPSRDTCVLKQDT